MRIIGLMSGSSTDGVDLALCEFSMTENVLYWKILKSATLEYPDGWKQRLLKLPDSSARELALADHEIGRLFGAMVKDFSTGEKVDYIASHGHTIFHEPEKKMTLQIGNGAAISQTSGIPAITDFRSSDIHLGGQGAPLASLIDRDLFKEYDALINLGGIANISIITKKELLAYDICPCNQLLNYLSAQSGSAFDEDGIMASSGKPDRKLLDKLASFGYFARNYPKSLDNNIIKQFFYPILDKSNIKNEDKLATCTELIVQLITKELKNHLTFSSDSRVLITGGGAKNKFLIKKISQSNKKISIIVPEYTLIDFKEALLMAYLGFLRISNQTNILSCVTGATDDSIGGALYISNKNIL
ncbi:MAG: anhydro-N-acetylmuramic acid kinase [Deltaproteobacteria bacterium]